MDASALIAAIALLISVWSLWRQRLTAGRDNLTAEWASGGTAIAITNHGPGPATAVSAARAGQTRDSLDLPYVAPLQTVYMSTSRPLGEDQTADITLAWKDNHLRPQTLPLILPALPSEPHSPTPKGDEVDKAVRKIARDEAERLLRERDRETAQRSRLGR